MGVTNMVYKILSITLKLEGWLWDVNNWLMAKRYPKSMAELKDEGWFHQSDGEC